MNGMLYGVGVGPGDPEHITLKAVRTIRECDIVAVPDTRTSDQVALEIAREYIEGKEVLPLHLPMTRDQEELAKCREEAAGLICRRLDDGQDVCFLTLGDPTVYSTYSYIHKLVTQRGYAARIIPGVPSFCAAAAALGEPLCEAGQVLHVIPASYDRPESALDLPGVKVLMKAGKNMAGIVGLLRDKGLLENTALAERVGMDGERLVRDLSCEKDSGYFSVIIVKEDKL